mmetsp:Transcript_18503/g.51441  ORF Transcript_18503/g.51441 Transcript_18503/m.51441 type:complete len:329 (-) Transcript_18503:245-1231(-)
MTCHIACHATSFQRSTFNCRFTSLLLVGLVRDHHPIDGIRQIRKELALALHPIDLPIHGRLDERIQIFPPALDHLFNEEASLRGRLLVRDEGLLEFVLVAFQSLRLGIRRGASRVLQFVDLLPQFLHLAIVMRFVLPQLAGVVHLLIDEARDDLFPFGGVLDDLRAELLRVVFGFLRGGLVYVHDGFVILVLADVLEQRGAFGEFADFADHFLPGLLGLNVSIIVLPGLEDEGPQLLPHVIEVLAQMHEIRTAVLLLFGAIDGLAEAIADVGDALLGWSNGSLAALAVALVLLGRGELAAVLGGFLLRGRSRRCFFRFRHLGVSHRSN